MRSQKNSRLAAPILFAAPQFSVTSGRSAIADTGALSTKFRRPFWVDEVRWTVSVLIESALATDSFAMQTRLRMGRLHLSDRYIPLQNYAPMVNDFCETSQVGIGAGFTQNIGWFRWKLPKPLFVPSGMTLVSDFFRPLGKTPSTATVDVAYAGRFMRKNEPTPEEIDVPWVTMFDPAADATFAQSSELDLYNPFQVPLEVQRFLFASQDETDGGITVNQNLVTVMKDSAGVNVVRDFTATGSVFDLNRRSWTFNKVLAPKERYNITLQRTSGGDLDDFHASIIGSRKERL